MSLQNLNIDLSKLLSDEINKDDNMSLSSFKQLDNSMMKDNSISFIPNSPVQNQQMPLGSFKQQDYELSKIFGSNNNLINPEKGLNTVDLAPKITKIPGVGYSVSFSKSYIDSLDEETRNKLISEFGLKPTDNGEYAGFKDASWMEKNQNLLGGISFGMNALSTGMSLYNSFKQSKALDKYITALKEQIKEAKEEYNYRKEGREHLKNVLS